MSDYDVSAAFRIIEDELITSMIRNMDRHRAEETKEGIQWAQWQVKQLKALERYKQENSKKYGKEFSKMNQQIEGLIRTAKQNGGMREEIRILQAIKQGYKGLGKRSATGNEIDFFRLNERKLNALVKATKKDMEKAETAILRMANDKYRKAIFNAQMYANTGAGTYEKAVDMATKDMLAAGLNCVEYKNGARHTLPDYADMAIRTASKRAYLQGEGEKRQEWGISTVIINKRGNPCPKCLPFVGKVLIDDVWSGGKPEDGPYPLMSVAIEAGLYHPRCKDGHTTYFPGISTADDTWTKEELNAIVQKNKKEIEKKYASRQVEKFERLAKYSLDEENKRKYERKAEQWGGEYKNRCRASLFVSWVKEFYENNPDIDLNKFGRKILDNLDLNDVSSGMEVMSDWGYCKLQKEDGDILHITDYRLNAKDKRPRGYHIKTAFHEAYHAKANGMKTDFGIIPQKHWLDIEETFAESSAHYLAGELGITDLSPSYAQRLVEVLPRLKQLPEYSSCSTIADFGKIAFENRMNGVASEWGELYNEIEKIPHSWKNYSKRYFADISDDVDGYVDKLVENMPRYENYKVTMVSDALSAMDKVNSGNKLSSNEKIVLSGIVAIAMNRLGVK